MSVFDVVDDAALAAKAVSGVAEPKTRLQPSDFWIRSLFVFVKTMIDAPLFRQS